MTIMISSEGEYIVLYQIKEGGKILEIAVRIDGKISEGKESSTDKSVSQDDAADHGGWKVERVYGADLTWEEALEEVIRAHRKRGSRPQEDPSG